VVPQNPPEGTRTKKGIKSIIAIISFVALCAILSYAIFRLGYKFGREEGLVLGKAEEKKEILNNREIKTSFFTTLWGLIDDYKKTQKLPAIKKNDALCQLAELRSNQIYTDWSHNYFHTNLDLLYNKYCGTCTKMGENLAKDFYTAQSVFDAWLNSPSHKAVLDAPYTIGCLSIKANQESYYVALEVAK